jgi:hypothetical protein
MENTAVTGNKVLLFEREDRDSDSLRARRSGDRVTVRADFPHPYRPALVPSQPPIQLVSGHSRG